MNNRKILVVEDEVWERKGIVSLLLGYSEEELQVYEAEDGEKAVHLLSQHRIDIILTDIKMPFMDGLDLIKWCRDHQKTAKIAVISGYSDFDYVKEALMAGAMDYLLKPVRQRDLEKCLKNISEALNKEYMEKELRRKQIRGQEMLQRYIRDIEMSNYFTARDRYNPDLIAIDQIPLPCRVLLLRYGSGRRPETTMEEMIERRFDLKLRLEAIFPSSAVFENCYKTEEYIIFAEETEAVCKEQILDSDLWKEAEKADFCIGSLLHDYKDIPSEYRNIITKIIRNKKIGSDKNIFDAQYKDVVSYAHLDTYQSQETLLRKAFTRKNLVQVKKILFETVNFQDIQSWYLFEAIQVLASIRNIVVSEAKEQDSIELQNLFDTMEAALSIRTLNGDILVELLSQVLDRFEEAKEADHTITDTIISRIKEYINENYGESITLQDIADKFYLNPSYLSRSFKKAEGKNLITYLTEIRIKHAEKYLQEGQHKLAEVAFWVGYDDYSYFNKVFKRYTGISPSEYMKHQGKN